MVMTLDSELAPRVARLETLFDERLGVRRGPFSLRAERVRRTLPRAVRGDLAQVAAALQIAGNPRLARQVEVERVTRAADRVEAHLRTIDPKERRRGRILGTLGVLMFNLLLLVAGVVAVLIWRGLI